MDEFRDYLCDEEKTTVTIYKYLYDVNGILIFMQDRKLNKENLLLYRKRLAGRYKTQIANVKFFAIHALLGFTDLEEYRVKLLGVQERAYIDEERELMELDYKKLMEAVDRNNKKQSCYLMLVLYETGIRISEFPFTTVEVIKPGKAETYMKGKYRVTIFPEKLARMLKEYTGIQNIQSGRIFRIRNEWNLDRSNICHTMKRLCKDARVEPTKAFPHNFRHLFAKCFYSIERNLANFTDILGHSFVETTRIYVAASTSQYEKVMEKVKISFDDKKPQNSYSAARQLIQTPQNNYFVVMSLHIK